MFDLRKLPKWLYETQSREVPQESSSTTFCTTRKIHSYTLHSPVTPALCKKSLGSLGLSGMGGNSFQIPKRRSTLPCPYKKEPCVLSASSSLAQPFPPSRYFLKTEILLLVYYMTDFPQGKFTTLFISAYLVRFEGGYSNISCVFILNTSLLQALVSYCKSEFSRCS